MTSTNVLIVLKTLGRSIRGCVIREKLARYTTQKMVQHPIPNFDTIVHSPQSVLDHRCRLDR